MLLGLCQSYLPVHSCLFLEAMTCPKPCQQVSKLCCLSAGCRRVSIVKPDVNTVELYSRALGKMVPLEITTQMLRYAGPDHWPDNFVHKASLHSPTAVATSCMDDRMKHLRTLSATVIMSWFATVPSHFDES